MSFEPWPQLFYFSDVYGLVPRDLSAFPQLWPWPAPTFRKDRKVGPQRFKKHRKGRRW